MPALGSYLLCLALFASIYAVIAGIVAYQNTPKEAEPGADDQGPQLNAGGGCCQGREHRHALPQPHLLHLVSRTHDGLRWGPCAQSQQEMIIHPDRIEPYLLGLVRHGCDIRPSGRSTIH